MKTKLSALLVICMVLVISMSLSVFAVPACPIYGYHQYQNAGGYWNCGPQELHTHIVPRGDGTYDVYQDMDCIQTYMTEYRCLCGASYVSSGSTRHHCH